MSCEAPVTANITAKKVTSKMAFLSPNTTEVLSEGSEKRDDFCALGAVFFSNIKVAGKTTKAMSKEKSMPADIIHPRLIMGWMCENRSDKNPAMVVRTAKKVGVALESMVSKMSL